MPIFGCCVMDMKVVHLFQKFFFNKVLDDIQNVE